MVSVSQEVFNQYREAKIIEIVQKIAKSKISPLLAFKGGTALRLFWGLPRFSHDVDYTLIKRDKRKEVYHAIEELAAESNYGITDAAMKFRTILFEFRFRWEGPNFRLKIEISDPLPQDFEKGDMAVRLAILRGVPIPILREEQLVAQKLCAFLERKAPRDLYDLWFILDKRLKIDWPYLLTRLGLESERDFFNEVQNGLKDYPRRRLVADIGQLVSREQREWLKTSFLDDLNRLIGERKHL